MKKSIITLLLTLCCILTAQAQTYKTIKDISYVSQNDTSAYRKERCKLDVYYPEGSKDFPTLIWFHGGGLKSGEKELLEPFKGQDLCVVSPNYRLYPKAKCPSYIEDAAAAVAWTVKHISEYGGDPKKIYISGHSAGGYLALILAMAKEYLAAYGIDSDVDIAGYLPVSGQTMTHFTIREERGMREGIPSIDEYAPIYHARKTTAKMCLITGDRNLEMADRWEENAIFYSVNKNQGNTNMELHELGGFNHGCAMPAAYLIVETLRHWEKEWGLKYYRKMYPEYFK